jgi:phenylalanyl-tRNA synthetase beta chain
MEDFIIEQMLSSGLYETYTYSFTSPKVFDRLNLPKDDKQRNAVVITNPLGEDFSVMRTTTIPQMLEVINTNYNRKVDEGRFFEISYVYLPREGEMLPDEKRTLTIGMYGNTDFYGIKGIVEQLILQMNIKNAEFIAEKNNPVFHPGKTARVVIGGETAGYVGEIHPDVADNFDCPYDTYIAVLEIKPLVENAVMEREYKPLPRYPAVSRDIAVIVSDDLPVGDIEKALKSRGGEYLEEIRLFDVYRGEQVPEGKKSVAYTLVFRSPDRTLVDDDVNRAVEDMLNELRRSFDAVLR